MSIDEALFDKLTDESHFVRTNRTYKDILESKAMDRHIVCAVLEKYARVQGFPNFEALNRFLSPTTRHDTLSFVERHNLGRRIDDEDRQRGGL